MQTIDVTEGLNAAYRELLSSSVILTQVLVRVSEAFFDDPCG